MPYVLRQNNPRGSSKRFTFYTASDCPVVGNHYLQQARVLVFYSRKGVDREMARRFKEQPPTLASLELEGWELVQIRNRLTPGLKAAAIRYNHNVRAIAGTSAMMSRVYTQLGYFDLAEEVGRQCTLIREQLAKDYAKVKADLLARKEEHAKQNR